MFNPSDYDLDREYRQRKMAQSIQVQQVDDVHTPKSRLSNLLLQVNFSSKFWIVALILFSIIFFSTQANHAQENTMFSAGTPSDTSGDVVYIYLRATILAIANDDFDSAFDYLDEAINAIPDFAPAYVAKSYIALQEGDFISALTHAETALAIYPDDAAIYFVLAESNFALENYEEAHSYYEIYLEMVTLKGHQPILITSLLNADSLPIVMAHLDTCIAEIVA